MWGAQQYRGHGDRGGEQAGGRGGGQGGGHPARPCQQGRSPRSSDGQSHRCDVWCTGSVAASSLVYNVLTYLLTLTLILTLATFTYATFYFAYMPNQGVQTLTSIIEVMLIAL